LLDLGCGVGNAFYPLVEQYGMPPLRIQCCDFSKKAINFVKENILYVADKISAHVVDLVKHEMPFDKESADFCNLVFVMSAIDPRHYD